MDGVALILGLAVVILFVVAWWRIFTKAGRAGWLSLIPIVNTIVLFQIAGKPGWWILLLLIPVVNFIVLVVVYFDLAKAFGQGTAFGCGLLLVPPIFFLILAFGDMPYVGV